MTTVRICLALGAMLTIAPAAQAKEKKPVDPNKKICRTDDATGSIMPKRTCRTASEWAAIDAVPGRNASTGDVRGHGGVRPAGF